MTGSPVKRAKILELQKERDEALAELERLRKKLPPAEPRETVGRPFTQENAKEASALAAEARKRNRDKGVTEKDLAEALKVLRRNMKSADEKVAHAAANKVLEYELGKPGNKTDAPERVVFESAYVDPKLATVKPGDE